MLPPTVPLSVEEPESQPYLGRVWAMLVVTLLLFTGLGARLWVLQVARYVDYERLAAHNRVRHEPTDAPRGGIFDRQGQLLAGSRLANRVAILDLADPHQVAGRRAPTGVDAAQEALAIGLPRPSKDAQLALLTRLLRLDAAEVAAIRAELGDPQRPRFTPVVVRDDVPPIDLTRIEERLWQLPNVILETIPFRAYPYGPVMAHVLGYVGSISPAELTARRAVQDQEIARLRAQTNAARREFGDDRLPELQGLIERLAILERLRAQAASTVGKTGVEAQYEAWLKGDPGILTWQVNARNEPIKLLNVAEGATGHSVVLNLDLRLQQLAARRLAGRRGSAVMLDCRSGAVLALCGSPSYDNNLFIPRIRSADWRRIVDDPAHPLQNRAIRNCYAPGSTFKMVTAAAGLHQGTLTDETWASCGGGKQIGGRFKKCWGVHGGVGLASAIAVSCDTFFYGVGLRLGPEPLLATAAEFGVGRPTGIDLPDEAKGRLPNLDWHRRHHERDWYPGDTANISIGQGDIACSSLQMAVITAAVANGGQVWQPLVVREIRGRDGQVKQRWRPRLLRTLKIDAAHFARIRRGMRAAVTDGTARVAALPGISVAGKTGSAEDPPRVLPHAWFVCFAPAERPEVACAVMVENAGHGGENCGPIAHDLLDLYFRSRGRTP